MLLKRLWGLAGLWAIIHVVLSFVEAVTDQSQQSGEKALVYLILAAFYFALWLIPGFKGNKWREENLSKRGYARLSSSQAETADDAVAEQVKMA